MTQSDDNGEGGGRKGNSGAGISILWCDLPPAFNRLVGLVPQPRRSREQTRVDPFPPLITRLDSPPDRS